MADLFLKGQRYMDDEIVRWAMSIIDGSSHTYVMVIKPTFSFEKYAKIGIDLYRRETNMIHISIQSTSPLYQLYSQKKAQSMTESLIILDLTK